MRRISLAAALLASLPLASCSPREPLAPAGDLSAVVFRDNLSTVPMDRATITAAEVREDQLLVQVTYGGGCAEHTFALFVQPGWMESNPVQVRAQLAHDARGDNCRALLAKELRFDLRPLKEAYQAAYSRSGTVVIQLREPGAGAATVPVRYSF